jgi:hypothetical protein
VQGEPGGDANDHTSELLRPAAFERPDHLTPMLGTAAKLRAGWDVGYWPPEP